MENFEDKAIVDLKKYKKLVEFYDKIPFEYVYCVYNSYGDNQISKIKTQSEAVKEVVEYNNKLASEFNKLNQKISDLEYRVQNLSSDKERLEQRYKDEIYLHNQTKKELNSRNEALKALTNLHNKWLDEIKNWSVFKFLRERNKDIPRTRFY